MREGQIHAHHERAAEEHAEADDPPRHQEQDETAAAPSRAPPRPDTLSSESARSHCSFCHGTPPAFACFSSASICLSSFCSPLCRSPAWPACHLTANPWINVP